MDYVDPAGEVLNIPGGAILGGIFGGTGGFISSAVSQKLSGEKFDTGKAWGAAANGAITGAVQGALIGSGAENPSVIILSESAFYNEATLANTIAHELSHCRDFLKGAGRLNPDRHKDHGQMDSLNICGGKRTVYGAGNALEAYIRGER